MIQSNQYNSPGMNNEYPEILQIKSPTKIPLYFLPALLLISCNLHLYAQTKGNETHIPDIVHPRFIDFPVPSAGIEVRTNPPVLRWPVTNHKNIKFDVRLSKNADFNQNDDYYEFTDLNWSMVNPHQKLDSGTWY